MASTDESCPNALVVLKAVEGLAAGEQEALTAAAAEFVGEISALADDASVRIDVDQTMSNIAANIGSDFDAQKLNRLLETTLHELRTPKTTNLEAPTTWSDLLVQLSAQDSSGNWRLRLRGVQRVPLIGSRVGRWLNEQILDRSQTVGSAAEQLLVFLDNKDRELRDANRGLEEAITVNDATLHKLLKADHFVRAIYAQLKIEVERKTGAVSQQRFGVFLRATADLIMELQECRATGEAIGAVYVSHIDSNWERLKQMARVRRTQVPFAIAMSIDLAAGIKEAEARKGTQAIEQFNKQMVRRMTVDLKARGVALRRDELRRLSADPNGLKGLLTALEAERRQQITHDRAVDARIEALIADGDRAVGRARAVRQSLVGPDGAQALAGVDKFLGSAPASE